MLYVLAVALTFNVLMGSWCVTHLLALWSSIFLQCDNGLRRSIQHQHLGQLALPAAEFLAVTHNTSYAGFSAERSLAIEQPFFQTGVHVPIAVLKGNRLSGEAERQASLFPHASNWKGVRPLLQ